MLRDLQCDVLKHPWWHNPGTRAVGVQPSPVGISLIIVAGIIAVAVVTRVIRVVRVGLNGNPDSSAPVPAPVSSAVPSSVPVPVVMMSPASVLPVFFSFHSA